MTQPYPFAHTADTKHAKASAATRLRSSPFTWTLVVSSALLTSRGPFHDLSLTRVKAEPSEYPV